MMTITTEYNETIREQIIGKLDGWEVILPHDDVGSGSSDVEAFITDINDYNKTMPCQNFDNRIFPLLHPSQSYSACYCTH